MIRQILTTAGIFGCCSNSDETAFVFRATSRWNLFVPMWIVGVCSGPALQSTFLPDLAGSLISLITALPTSSTITDVTSGSVRCLPGLSVMKIYLGGVPVFCVGWTGNGGCVACFKCLWCRCKIRGSGVPEGVRSHIVVRTREMMKVVASATCSLECSRNRRFHSLTFSHDMIRYVLFTLRFFFSTCRFPPGKDTL